MGFDKLESRGSRTRQSLRTTMVGFLAKRTTPVTWVGMRSTTTREPRMVTRWRPTPVIYPSSPHGIRMKGPV